MMNSKDDKIKELRNQIRQLFLIWFHSLNDKDCWKTEFSGNTVSTTNNIIYREKLKEILEFPALDRDDRERIFITEIMLFEDYLKEKIDYKLFGQDGEWISASNARDILSNVRLGTAAICARAYGGLVKARAVRLIRDKQSTNNSEVPQEFWWAKGHEALIQNWDTGDFETWINQNKQLRAFGVTFRRADIEAMVPASSPTPSPDAVTLKPTGGRPQASWSDDLWIEMSRQLYSGDLKPQTQGDITKAMFAWLAAKNHQPADSVVKGRARKLWTEISKVEK